jgi:hypothetical protein
MAYCKPFFKKNGLKGASHKDIPLYIFKLYSYVQPSSFYRKASTNKNYKSIPYYLFYKIKYIDISII